MKRPVIARIEYRLVNEMMKFQQKSFSQYKTGTQVILAWRKTLSGEHKLSEVWDIQIK